MSFMFGKTPKLTQPKAMPTTAVIAEKEKKKMRKGITGRETLLTSPLGLTTPAGTRRKTLLGE